MTEMKKWKTKAATTLVICQGEEKHFNRFCDRVGTALIFVPLFGDLFEIKWLLPIV